MQLRRSDRVHDRLRLNDGMGSAVTLGSVRDPFHLERFVAAQDTGGTYLRAVEELRAGRKRSHWMWFVLPQLAGLGRSEMSKRYAISALGEARAYVAHPVLGPRLHECAQALLETEEADPVAIMGSVDAVKLRSSMTLFAAAAPQVREFVAVLDRCFASEQDAATIELLGAGRDAGS